jgi:nucleoside-diphosphate-sugar epimerase
MNVFIAGATGYAGRAIALIFRQAGHHVTVLLRSPDSERAHLLRGVGIQVIAGDLRRPATYRTALAACEVCITTATPL